MGECDRKAGMMHRRPFNIFILTGAGISAESGLSTFRDENGLWAGHKIEDVCTRDGLARNPDLVCAFYDERKAAASKASPNSASLRRPPEIISDRPSFNTSPKP